MPLYEFFCDKCQKEVSLTLSISEREKGDAKCPQCGSILKVLLFLGVQPDGYVCETCKLWYSDDLKPLAAVIE